MILFLTGFLAAVFIPLFISSWRVAFLGLTFQALSMALLLLGQEPAFDLETLFRIGDLVLLRFLAVPILFISVLRQNRLKSELDLVPPNLITWILAVGVLILALSFGHRLSPDDLSLMFHMALVASAILVGLLILSVQVEPLGQMVGLLYIESGITLLELAGHREPWFLQFAVSLIFLWLIVLMGGFLRKFARFELSGSPSSNIEPEVL